MEFRKAEHRDIEGIVSLLTEAKRFMAGQGIDQWQDGYPSRELICEDIEVGRGYVMAYGDDVAAYCVIVIGDEPDYHEIRNGRWTLEGEYLTIHRIAASDRYRGRGVAALLVQNAAAIARSAGIPVMRADTHLGNRAMQAFLAKHGYTRCGEVTVACGGDTRRAAYERPTVL